MIGIDLEERKIVIIKGAGKLSGRRKTEIASAAEKEMHQRFSRRRQPTVHTLTKYEKDMAMLPSKLSKDLANLLLPSKLSKDLANLLRAYVARSILLTLRRCRIGIWQGIVCVINTQ